MANEAVIRIRSDAGQALKGIQSVEKSLHRMNNVASRKGGKGGGGGSDRMMMVAQFADDAQYGLRAVTNQVGQLAQSFGMSGKAAGGLLFAAVGLNLILGGQAKKWGENIGKMVAGGDELEKEFNANAEASRRLFQEQEDGIARTISAYEKLIETNRDFARANSETLAITQATLSNRQGITAETQSRRASLFSAFEQRQQGRGATVIDRAELAKKRSDMEKRFIRENADLELRIADEKLAVERQNRELQLRTLQEEERVRQKILSVDTDGASERYKESQERIKAARAELETMNKRIRVMEIERYGVEAMMQERLKTAEQERQIRLESLKEEGLQILRKEADDTNSRLRELSGQSMAVGTSLQKVGLGKTPELVQQVDLARKSEAHLAKIARAMEKLKLGLN